MDTATNDTPTPDTKGPRIGARLRKILRLDGNDEKEMFVPRNRAERRAVGIGVSKGAAERRHIVEAMKGRAEERNRRRAAAGLPPITPRHPKARENARKARGGAA